MENVSTPVEGVENTVAVETPVMPPAEPEAQAAVVKTRKKPQKYGVNKQTFVETWNNEANKTLADVCKALNMPANVVNVRACNYRKHDGVSLKKLERRHKAVAVDTATTPETTVVENQVAS